MQDPYQISSWFLDHKIQDYKIVKPKYIYIFTWYFRQWWNKIPINRDSFAALLNISVNILFENP